MGQLTILLCVRHGNFTKTSDTNGRLSTIHLRRFMLVLVISLFIFVLLLDFFPFFHSVTKSHSASSYSPSSWITLSPSSTIAVFSRLEGGPWSLSPLALLGEHSSVGWSLRKFLNEFRKDS